MNMSPEQLALPAATLAGVVIVLSVILGALLASIIIYMIYRRKQDAERPWISLLRYASKRDISIKHKDLLRAFFEQLPAKTRLETLMNTQLFYREFKSFLARTNAGDEDKIEVLNKLFEYQRLAHEIEKLDDFLVGESITVQIITEEDDYHLLMKIAEVEKDALLLSYRANAVFPAGSPVELHAYRPAYGAYELKGTVRDSGRNFIHFAPSGELVYHGSLHLMTLFELQLNITQWPPTGNKEDVEIYRAHSLKVSDRGVVFTFLDHVTAKTLRAQKLWQLETILPGDYPMVVRGTIGLSPGNDSIYIFRFIDLNEETLENVVRFIREHEPRREHLN